jgi:hypothetical protein
MYAGFRTPRTFQEHKLSYLDPEVEALGIKPRAKRQGRNLRDAWDDIPRSDSRSWKKHRRSQFRDAQLTRKERALVIEMKESVAGE